MWTYTYTLPRSRLQRGQPTTRLWYLEGESVGGKRDGEEDHSSKLCEQCPRQSMPHPPVLKFTAAKSYPK